jgi:uncharacterized membrane protein
MFLVCLRVLLLVAAATLMGCGTGTTPVGTSGTQNEDSGSSSSGLMEEPLPCELSDMLSDRCGQCHGNEPKFGALRSLVSHDDLVASGDGHDSLAEAAITRMSLPSSDEERMPLAPRPTASPAEVELVRNFVNAGFPLRAEGETCE